MGFGLKNKPNDLKYIRSFTLTELLIVIAILAVLAAAVLIALNIGEYLAQSRDAKRISDIDSLNAAVGLYAASVSGSKGVANKVYISIPSANADCSDITGLPVLTGGWTYACATTANYLNTNGTGWLPVNLDALPGGSTVNKLPVDPKNVSAGGYYYSYAVGSDGTWELSAATESRKIGLTRAVKDGGTNSLTYEAGKSLAVIPDVSLGVSCNAVHTAYPTAPTGGYLIDPDGVGALPTMPVFCDMESDGGGWTLAAVCQPADGNLCLSTGAVGDTLFPSSETTMKLSDQVIKILIGPNGVTRGEWTQQIRSCVNNPTKYKVYNQIVDPNSGWQSNACGTSGTRQFYIKTSYSAGWGSVVTATSTGCSCASNGWSNGQQDSCGIASWVSGCEGGPSMSHRCAACTPPFPDIERANVVVYIKGI